MPTPEDFAKRAERAKGKDAIKFLFNDIAALPAADAQKAIDAVEEVAIRDFRDGFDPDEMKKIDWALDVVRQLKDLPENDPTQAYMGGLEIEEGPKSQAQAELFRRIAHEKGASASPIVTAFLAEAAKLPRGEFGTALGRLKLVKMMQQREEGETATPAESASKPSSKSQNFDF